MTHPSLGASTSTPTRPTRYPPRRLLPRGRTLPPGPRLSLWTSRLAHSRGASPGPSRAHTRWRCCTHAATPTRPPLPRAGTWTACSLALPTAPSTCSCGRGPRRRPPSRRCAWRWQGLLCRGGPLFVWPSVPTRQRTWLGRCRRRWPPRLWRRAVCSLPRGGMQPVPLGEEGGGGSARKPCGSRVWPPRGRGGVCRDDILARPGQWRRRGNGQRRGGQPCRRRTGGWRGAARGDRGGQGRCGAGGCGWAGITGRLNNCGRVAGVEKGDGELRALLKYT